MSSFSNTSTSSATTHSGTAATKTSSLLFITGLPHKWTSDVAKSKLIDVFDVYGIEDIDIPKNRKMRGTAFIHFKDSNGACRAKDERTSFMFGKYKPNACSSPIPISTFTWYYK